MTGVVPRIVVPLLHGEEYCVPITVASRPALLSDLEARLVSGQGFAVATLNLDHLVKLRALETFRSAYAGQSHVVADGNPVIWLARLAGHRVDLVPGSDLVVPVAELAARRKVPVGLFGTTPETLDGAAAELTARCPGLEIAERIAPPFGFDPQGGDADAILARIADSPARLWFLALGAPKQEIFAARALGELPGRGFVSVGAGLDFLAGTQQRAPRIVRAVACEWLWRMARNPMLLGPRYARCIAALPGLVRAALKQRRAHG